MKKHAIFSIKGWVWRVFFGFFVAFSGWMYYTSFDTNDLNRKGESDGELYRSTMEREKDRDDGKVF